MSINCLPIPDYSKPPPNLVQYPPPANFYQSPGQESDSLFSEGSSMTTSSRHRDEGPSHWDQRSDSAKGSTPLLEDQNSYWNTSHWIRAPPTSWYQPSPGTLSHLSGIDPEPLNATAGRDAQIESEDWADHSSVFADWDQYRLIEEEEVVERAEEGKRKDFEKDCKDVVDMEICSIASENNDEGVGNRIQPTPEVNSFSETDRLTDSQMLSLLRHLSAPKQNNTSKHICHTIELFLTLLPVQLQKDTVELRKASMSSAQKQVFELLQSRAPWVVDEQIIRSMDLLPFILKRILTMELPSVPQPSNDQVPRNSGPTDHRHNHHCQHHHHRRHSPQKARSSSTHRRRRERSSSPIRRRGPHRDTAPPREARDSLPSTAGYQPPLKRAIQCEGWGRNIFRRSSESRTHSHGAEARPGRGHRAKATVRLQHIDGEGDELPTDDGTEKGAEVNETDQRQRRERLQLISRRLQTRRVAVHGSKSALETFKKRSRRPVVLRQTSTIVWRKKPTAPVKKRLVNGKAPSLLSLPLPSLPILRQATKPTFVKKQVFRRRQPPALLTFKVPLLSAAPSTHITPIPYAPNGQVTSVSLAQTAPHRGLLPDPGSQEHSMIIGMETVSRLGLQAKFR